MTTLVENGGTEPLIDKILKEIIHRGDLSRFEFSLRIGNNIELSKPGTPLKEDQ
jgi:hypothetical protein